MQKRIFLLYCFVIFFGHRSIAQTVKFDEIKPQCTDLPINKRVRVAVSSFDVATVDNPGQLGDELAQMLTDALQQVNCFNVLLSSKDAKNITDEQKFAQEGNTADGSSPETGQMKGAQVIVMGKVTSYAAGEKSGGAMGVQISGGNKARVSFIIQLINPTTREIITSTSIQTDGKTGGFSGVKVLGANFAGGSGNKAVQDAIHKGIIQAVQFIASNKDKMPLPEGGSGIAEVKKFTSANCAVLNSSHIPKIMVIIPEYHNNSIRLPEPAGEGEINRKLVEAGFTVVDPAMFATINNSIEFKDATSDPAKAISIGKQFGADVVIYGEGVSEYGDSTNGRISCRARVEMRAVRTDNAAILATNGLTAGGIDISELMAAKSALRNAASKAADYVLEQFCTKNLTFSNTSTETAVPSGKPFSEITLLHAEYADLKDLATLLASKGKVVTKNIADGKGYIKLEHNGSTDSIADFIDSKAGSVYRVQDVAPGKITIAVK